MPGSHATAGRPLHVEQIMLCEIRLLLVDSFVMQLEQMAAAVGQVALIEAAA